MKAIGARLEASSARGVVCELKFVRRCLVSVSLHGRGTGSLLLAALALCAACQEASVSSSQRSVECDDEPPRRVTFRQQLRSKLFIDRVPFSDCNPTAVLSAGRVLLQPSVLAQYMAFCKLTDESYKERPATGAGGDDTVTDARLLAIVPIHWSCVEGQTLPVDAAVGAFPLNAIPGRELGPIRGVPDRVQVRDDINRTGEFTYVVSGKPAEIFELSFTYFRSRANPHIWHKVKGKVTCSTDSNGNISSDLDVKLDAATKFPSHRVYLYQEAGIGPLQIKIVVDQKQGKFSNLWHLPPVGTP
jgi:hypothetical protein